jgi:hypothetical protein
VPAGFSTVENDLPKGAFTETKWQNAADGSTLLVDYSPASGASPQGQGAPVRRAVQKQPGYSQVNWGPGDLPGRQSWKWTFSLPSQGQSVDYFFSECGTDYAVLGTASPSQFSALAGRFRDFAASVKHC